MPEHIETPDVVDATMLTSLIGEKNVDVEYNLASPIEIEITHQDSEGNELTVQHTATQVRMKYANPRKPYDYRLPIEVTIYDENKKPIAFYEVEKNGDTKVINPYNSKGTPPPLSEILVGRIDETSQNIRYTKKGYIEMEGYQSEEFERDLQEDSDVLDD